MVPFLRAASSYLLALTGFWRAVYLCVAVLSVMGCERSIAPPLVEVIEFAPRAIEPGDRLEIRGNGFPQGRTGRITLDGAVYRPGESPIRGVSVDVEGTVATSGSLELIVRDDLVEQLCGRGDRATHATFRGDVEVAFASDNQGAPPLVGVLHGVELDVMPSSVRATALEARIAEGRRVLAFFGIAPGLSSPRGLPIEQVIAGSPAERAGIQVGDVLIRVDGVNVLSVGDVLPASARAVVLMVRHGDTGVEEAKTLSLFEYSGGRVLVEYASALLIVGLALAVLALLVLPGPSSLVAFELRIASRVRRTTWRAALASLFGGGRHAAFSAMVSAVIATFALTPYVVGREVDGVVLLVASTSLLVASRVVRARGLFASGSTLLWMAFAVVAMTGAVALAIGQVGALELVEIVRIQGGAPWHFNAVKYPSCAVLGVVYAGAIVGVLRVRPSERAASESLLPSSPAPSPPRAALLERVGVLFAAALGVTVFLGGWQLPGIVVRGHALALLSAASFVVKTWALSALLLGSSRVASGLEPRAVQVLFVKKLLPGLLVAGALVAVSRRLVPSAAVETALSATLVAVAVLLVVRMAARVRWALDRPEPHASPFL